MDRSSSKTLQNILFSSEKFILSLQYIYRLTREKNDTWYFQRTVYVKLIPILRHLVNVINVMESNGLKHVVMGIQWTLFPQLIWDASIRIDIRLLICELVSITSHYFPLHSIFYITLEWFSLACSSWCTIFSCFFLHCSVLCYLALSRFNRNVMAVT